MQRSFVLRFACLATASFRISSFQYVFSFQPSQHWPARTRTFDSVADSCTFRHLALAAAGASSSSSSSTGSSVEEGAILTAAAMPVVPDVATTAKRLFLVRHGEVINPGGDRSVYYGAMDVPLSTLGEQEAVAAAQYLAQFELSAVLSSTLSRAIYGAQQVCQFQKGGREHDVIALEGFKELDRGDWCGKTLAEIGADAMARFDACDEAVTPAHGESYPALKRRVLAARDAALDSIRPGQAAAVVSHLQVTRCILSDALNIPTNQMTKLPVATASITCIDYDYADSSQPPIPTVHFQSLKPNVGLKKSKDGAN